MVGSLLRTRLVDSLSPIAYGIRDRLAVYSDGGESFGVSGSRGGRGGGGGGGGRGGGEAERATGRGTPDDADVVQGRPPLDTANLALPARAGACRGNCRRSPTTSCATRST